MGPSTQNPHSAGKKNQLDHPQKLVVYILREEVKAEISITEPEADILISGTFLKLKMTGYLRQISKNRSVMFVDSDCFLENKEKLEMI